jgi:hypothetical protein
MKLKNYLLEETKTKAIFGSDKDFSYAIKIDGIPSDFITMPFGRKTEYNKVIKEFQDKAKTNYVDAKGKGTLPSVKKWVKEEKPNQFFAKWKKDSSSYKDDSVKIWYA